MNKNILTQTIIFTLFLSGCSTKPLSVAPQETETIKASVLNEDKQLSTEDTELTELRNFASTSIIPTVSIPTTDLKIPEPPQKTLFRRNTRSNNRFDDVVADFKKSVKE